MKSFFRLALLGLVLVIVALVSMLTAMRLAIHGREVAVPDLTGKTPVEAKTLAEQNGFTLEIERQYYSPNVPEGRILSQLPPAGMKVRRGWQLRVAQSLAAARGNSQRDGTKPARCRDYHTSPRAGGWSQRPDSALRHPCRPGGLAKPAAQCQRRLRAQNQPSNFLARPTAIAGNAQLCGPTAGEFGAIHSGRGTANRRHHLGGPDGECSRSAAFASYSAPGSRKHNRLAVSGSGRKSYGGISGEFSGAVGHSEQSRTTHTDYFDFAFVFGWRSDLSLR